jgi:spermidine/putrescine transport system substrate-binding protein
MEWMNFYYQPPIEGLIEDWVNYICPVPGAKSVIANALDDRPVADSPLVFPPPSMRKRLRGYYDFKGIEDHQAWTSIFDPIIQS